MNNNLLIIIELKNDKIYKISILKITVFIYMLINVIIENFKYFDQYFLNLTVKRFENS